jgi:DNA modification methylase
MVKLLKGDCLIESDKIESGSVDLILTDLPYGTMEGQSSSGIYHQGKEKHEWDNIIPTDKIMEIGNRILRKNGKMILFAQEPFTNKLMNSAISNLPFNYRAIWLKDTLGSFMRSKKALLYKTEDILLFSKNHDTEDLHPLRNYLKECKQKSGMTNKQFNHLFSDYTNKKGNRNRSVLEHYWAAAQFHLPTEDIYKNILQPTGFFSTPYEELKKIDNEFKKQFASTFNLWEGNKYKSNVFEFKRDRDNYHPTQKPVLLLEDLIKTFSNENDLIVDLTMGSGSTGVAAKNTNRNFIGIEKDENYFNIAEKRING